MSSASIKSQTSYQGPIAIIKLGAKRPSSFHYLACKRQLTKKSAAMQK